MLTSRLFSFEFPFSKAISGNTEQFGINILNRACPNTRTEHVFLKVISKPASNLFEHWF